MDRRIGVYICHCGSNIAGTVDVAEVARYAGTLDSVVISRDYRYMCSTPGQELIRKGIIDLELNRVVIASCTPRMHELTFRNVCQDAGLNPYLYEHANIREQCSWPHTDRELATDKAKDLVRAAVRRVYYHEPLEVKEAPVNPNVLVVGAGVAGIQAALDIANGEYKVYLVEREPSIGGHMIQFDRTFPTLDCPECILTPKMTEVAQHPFIDLLAYSEVEEVSGFVGNFKVKIRKKARFVDESKCIGCDVCEQKCPWEIDSEFEAGLAKRKAIYIPFPQAVPNVATIDKTEERPCKAACMDACPINTNVLGYSKLISEGEYQAAYELIRNTNPLPSTCGRVCYAPCEEVCNRGQIDESIAIRELKRFATDQVDIEQLEVPVITKVDKKVAIVGSGPAGLAAANDLALKGYEATIFEALPQPGGMLRVGIPEYRLPKAILQKEIDYIQKLGVQIKTGVRVGKDISLLELKGKYDALFVAAGAHGGISLKVEGESLPGVMDGIKFLRAMNLGEKVRVGRKTAVIGGGNTAIDCARAAMRLGAEEVTVIYRRSRAEIPASEEEIEALEEEGIRIEFLTTPVRFLPKDGKLAEMECIKMKLGEPDASGRPQPIPVEGSEFTSLVDTVITALGQTPETEFVKELGLSLSRGRIEINSKTGATNIEGVFAGGDVVTGPAYVIDAIAAGKRSARSIDLYLQGEPIEVEEEEKKPEKLSPEEIEDRKKRFLSQRREKVKQESIGERLKDFREVSLGYTSEEAINEASRCLAGQMEGCFECHECEKQCEAKAIDFGQTDQIIEVEVGSIILATGYDIFDPGLMPQYGYGRYDNILTGLEFERMTCAGGPTEGRVLLKNGKEPESVAIVHCVGSRDKNYHEYCSRVCCMYGLKYAHLLRELTKAEVYEMYIDMRCFGEGYEEFYERVSKEGINFVRGKVAEITADPVDGKLIVYAADTVIGKALRVYVDMVILCTALEARSDAEQMAKTFRISQRADGFFLERHVKLDPIATQTSGIFISGCCEGPKDIPDTVAQASAAAAKVLSLVSKGKITLESAIASVDKMRCLGCGRCEEACTFNAPKVIIEDGVLLSTVNEALCQGCGACAIACPSGAMSVRHFTREQITSVVDALTEVRSG
ncbi:FAD-dependent oxidoreductase [Chloroflexota bacterium]